VPAAVVALAARLLPSIAPSVAPPEPVRTNPGRLDVVRVDDGPGIAAAVVRVVADVSTREGSIGIIAADAVVGSLRRAFVQAGLTTGAPDDEDDPRLMLVPATLSKGLEFDHVVVVEPAQIVVAEPRGLRRLYVALTRAVSSLTIVHAEPLPAVLTDSGV
jgi:hypothetical protein